MTTIVQQLTAFGEASTYDALPAVAAGEAKRLLLDSVACAIAALGVEKGRAAVRVAESMGGAGEVSVIGTGKKLPAMFAVFANGELINALDFDAINTPPGHVVPYILPAILGMAEQRKRSGKDLIAAIAVGQEVSARMGKAMGYYRDTKPGQKLTLPDISGFSSTIFGGTLGTAMMRGLDAAQTANALGLAGRMTPVQTLGKFGRTLPGSDDKYHPSGWMGQAELMAVAMAENGYSGDVEVFEGDWGYWKFSGAGGWNPNAITDGLGTVWTYPVTTIYKPWPHCRQSHTVIGCLRHIIEANNLRPEDIDSITAYWDSMVAELPVAIWSTKNIQTVMDAQMTTAWALIMAAYDVPRGPEWYTEDTLANPAYRAFLDRIHLKPHPGFAELLRQDPQTRLGKVEVVARGRTFTEERTHRKGSPATPETYMTNDELADKLRDCAAGVIADDRAERIIGAIWNLEEMDDVSKLGNLW